MNSRLMGIALCGFCIGAYVVSGAPDDKRTTITSKRASFDYKRSVAEFVGDVVVVDPEVTMNSDRLAVLFDGSNDVKSVTATGGVRLRYQGKNATCKKAVYIAGEGYIVMTGDVVIRDAKDMVEGDVVQIWIHDEKMTVEPGRLVIFPGEDRKKSTLLKTSGGGRAAGKTAR